jgi:hypothetical protein
MTDIFFPSSPYNNVAIQSQSEEIRKNIKISSLLAK